MGNSTSQNFYSNCQNLNMANFLDVNGIVNCAIELNGKSSDSASPSDIILFDFVPNSNYDGEKIFKGFQKIFVTNYDQLINNDKILVDYVDKNKVKYKLDMLKYEYYVYLNKIKPLVEKNINPHFIKVLGGKLDVSYEDLENYILDKTKIENESIKINMIDNFIFTIHNIEGRKSLTEKNDTSSLLEDDDYFIYYKPKKIYQDISSIINDVKYGFIITEGIDVKYINNFSEFLNLPLNKSITLIKFLTILRYHSNRDEILDYVYYLYFQIFSACYALYLTGVNHNDLHSGNIWIKKTEPHINEYHINNRVFRILVDYKVMIYDFDRSYCESYNMDKRYNNINDNGDIINSLFLFKDILKASLTLYDLSPHDEKENIIKILSKDIKNLKETFDGPSEKRFDRDMRNINGYITKEELDESNFYPIEIILDNLYSKFINFNEKRIKEISNIRERIYVCNPKVFYNGNILNNILNFIKK